MLGGNMTIISGHEAAPASVASGLATVPLSDALGAEIIGVDVSEDLSDALFSQILDVWHENGVILFRNQDLNEEAQARFAARFGSLGTVNNNHNGRSRIPGVMYISNVREDGKLVGALPDGEMFFHSDQCYIERPCMATMLYAMEVPRKGGNTLFANMYKAYETLPQSIKDRIEGRKALNVYDYDNNATRRGSEPKEGIPSFAHPVVRVHPATGRKALYVNRLMTHHIEGLPQEESDQLLESLFDHQEQRQFVYEHVWKPGELLLWDNRCTLHARSDFDASERRMMRRVAILGDRPV
jgi:taurine dioxygenase